MEQYNERKSEAGAGAAVPGPRSGQSGGSSCMPAAPHNKTDEVGAAAAAQEAAMNDRGVKQKVLGRRLEQQRGSRHNKQSESTSYGRSRALCVVASDSPMQKPV